MLNKQPEEKEKQKEQVVYTKILGFEPSASDNHKFIHPVFSHTNARCLKDINTQKHKRVLQTSHRG
jgi:hypothetical protein